MTITGPPGVGTTRFIQAVLAERPEAEPLLHESNEPRGGPSERVYALRTLAEAPAIELYRLLSGDDETPYAELAERTRGVGRIPGAIAAMIHHR